jgi:hypothetical protein
MAWGFMRRPGAQVRVDVDARDKRPVRFDQARDSGRDVLGPLGIGRQGGSGDPAVTTHFETPCQSRLRISNASRPVLVVGMHPELAAGALDDRRCLPPMICVSVCADQQPDVLDAQVDLIECPLELGQRARFVHARVDQHDAVSGRNCPGVAMGNPRPGEGQSQAPEAGQDPLSASELALSWHAAHDIARRVDCGASMPRTAEIAKRYFAALSAHDLDAALGCGKPGAVDRLVGTGNLVAPEGIRDYFSMLFAAFPDFELEVLDVVAVEDGLIVHNEDYVDTGDVARQLGLLPAAGSTAEARLAKLAIYDQER